MPWSQHRRCSRIRCLLPEATCGLVHQNEQHARGPYHAQSCCADVVEPLRRGLEPFEHFRQLCPCCARGPKGQGLHAFLEGGVCCQDGEHFLHSSFQSLQLEQIPQWQLGRTGCRRLTSVSLLESFARLLRFVSTLRTTPHDCWVQLSCTADISNIMQPGPSAPRRPSCVPGLGDIKLQGLRQL